MKMIETLGPLPSLKPLKLKTLKTLKRLKPLKPFLLLGVAALVTYAELVALTAACG